MLSSLVRFVRFLCSLCNRHSALSADQVALYRRVCFNFDHYNGRERESTYAPEADLAVLNGSAANLAADEVDRRVYHQTKRTKTGAIYCILNN